MSGKPTMIPLGLPQVGGLFSNVDGKTYLLCYEHQLEHRPTCDNCSTSAEGFCPTSSTHYISLDTDKAYCSEHFGLRVARREQ